jgi:N-acetylglutamate synthase-like GNAT family acetyltransferase
MIPQPSHLLIENVAVLPDRHGEGIGGLLLERADAVARSLGLSELRLYTNALFSVNISFYAHRGFKEFLREPHAAGGEVVHMKKTIAL